MGDPDEDEDEQIVVDLTEATVEELRVYVKTALERGTLDGDFEAHRICEQLMKRHIAVGRRKS